jgi:thioredoxin reductase
VSTTIDVQHSPTDERVCPEHEVIVVGAGFGGIGTGIALQRFDLAIVPVRTEAWLGYFMLRIAPGINRRMTQPFSVQTLEKTGSRIQTRLGGSSQVDPVEADPESRVLTESR